MSIEITAACFVFFVLSIFVWIRLRSSRIDRLRRRAIENLRPESMQSEGFAETLASLTKDKITAAELSTYAPVTAAEFVWNWATIDPHVIQAADFSARATIDNGFQFAQYLHEHFDSLTADSKEGFVKRLMGYVGEQQVADILKQQGHPVTATIDRPVLVIRASVRKLD